MNYFLPKTQQDSFYHLITQFVKNRQKLQKDPGFQKFYSSYPNGLKDFFSLRIGLPRRAGSSILACRLLKHFTDSVLICHSFSITKELRDYKGVARKCRNRILECGARNYCGYSNVNTVIVDECEYVNMAEIYAYFPAGIFILLGSVK